MMKHKVVTMIGKWLHCNTKSFIIFKIFIFMIIILSYVERLILLQRL